MADKVVPIRGRAPAKKAPAKKAAPRKTPTKAAAVKASAGRHPAGKAVARVDHGPKVREGRLDGKTYAAIAEELEMPSATAALRAEQRYLERIAVTDDQQDRSAQRQMEIARLDRLQAKYMAAALNGDVKMAELVLRIIDQRSKLLGLYEQEAAVSNTFNTVIVTGDASEYVAQLRAVVEQRPE